MQSPQLEAYFRIWRRAVPRPARAQLNVLTGQMPLD